MLTLQKLKEMEPFETFMSGDTIDNHTGCNMTGTSKILTYVACRGQIHDWAIYCQYKDEGWSLQRIHDEGEKVTSEEHIKRLVPCDKQAFEMYRY